jgi:Putative Ice-binding-like adhesive domain/PilX N-terminal
MIRTNDERGIALILTLFLSAAISLLAASLITVSMSETAASQNYRMMSQARYAAESAVHKTVNYLMNTYTAPGTSGSDLLSSYSTTGSPVTYSSNPVILSSDPAVTANYADSTKSTAFATATAGTLTAGTATLNYNASAQLMSMRTVISYGGASKVVQTWLITGNGTITGASTASETVTSTLEREITSAAGYAAFSTASTCGALTFENNAVSYSYDSSTMTMSGGAPVAQSYGGSVGSNGNITVNNNALINGSVSSARSGVGTCATGDPTAETLGIQAVVTGGLIHLSQTQTFQTPAPLSPAPGTTTLTIGTATTCASIPLPVGATCTGLPNNLTIHPNGATVVWPNVVLSNNVHFNLDGGTYNVNSFKTNNNNVLTLTGTNSAIMNVQGTGQTTPLEFDNNSTFSNASFDPSRMQFVYGGTGLLNLSNNTAICAMVYAPNATVNLANNGDFYGSIIAATTTVNNNGSIYYDRHLTTLVSTVGNWMLSTFNWKKY